MGTVIVVLILIFIVVMIIKKILKDRKNGKPLCGGDCSSCHGSCNQTLNNAPRSEEQKNMD